MVDKQIESIIRYFTKGCKDFGNMMFGIEIEHILVQKDSREAVRYDYDADEVEMQNKVSVKRILQNLLDSGEYQELEREGNFLLGVKSDKVQITLEPGAQLEIALGPYKINQLNDIKLKYNQTIDDIKAITGNNIDILNIGYQEQTKFQNIRLIPKKRYYAMDEYLTTSGKYGLNMMRCSASTQVSIDYFSEEDAFNKYKVASILSPIFCHMFANTPYFEGKDNDKNIIRLQMWDDIDKARCGIPNFIFSDSKHFFNNYANYALKAPLMVANFMNTTEKSSQISVFATNDNAHNLYPNRSLNIYEIEHILSTFFFDVRLKNFIELRSCDSLPIDDVLKYLNAVKTNFYDQQKLKFWVRRFEDVKYLDVIDAKMQIVKYGNDANVYGQNIKEIIRSL